MSHGSDMYKRDCYNNAPIHRAVSHGQGHEDVLDYFLTVRACNPKITGYQGKTLLHFACASGNTNLVNTLIQKYGITPMATDAVKQTPLHIAASHGQEEIVRLLISKYNCPVDCRSNYRLSPLHLACYCGHASVVKLLVLEYKADVNALDEHEDTPLLKAAMGDDLDLVQMMITDFDLDPLSTTDSSGNTPLHIACYCGRVELTRLLITKYNCPVDVINKNKETPLHIACYSGNLSVVRMLVSEFKALASLQNDHSEMPISKAAEGGHAETVQTLITDLGNSPKVTGYEGRSLLHEACCSGSIKLTEMLIVEFNLNVSSVDDKGNTPLHMACWNGDEGLVRLLIKYNCPVDIQNGHNETPLHVACLAGHSCVVRLLVSEYNADTSVRDDENDTAVSKAAEGGHAETVQTLITDLGNSPKVTGYEGRSLLHEACCNGSIKLTEMLIVEFNLNVSSVDDRGNTPLHMACWYGHEDLVRLLIKYNCPVDIQNGNNETPLHVACLAGHSCVVRLLVSEYNADTSVRDDENDTAVSKAAEGGHVETVRILILELKCSPKITGCDGRTLLHEACCSGSIELVEMLITRFGLDTLSTDKKGDTSLHLACWCGHKEVVRLLISKHKCPVDVINKNKETPLHIACLYGHSSVVRLLVSDFKANLMVCDHENDAPINKAALGGHADIVQMLITEFDCSPYVKGFEGRSLLHQACWEENTLIAKKLIKDFPLLIHLTDSNGDSPLHIASLFSQPESVRLLLFNCHAPVFRKNKAGKTALDLVSDDATKNVFKEYMCSKDIRSLQQNYEKMHTLSLQKYSGHKIITRMFVLGNSGSGKSTLIESLKRKGFLFSIFLVPEGEISPHTAGIIPSMYQSNTELFLYYDFAGDREYYSSDAAILEMVSCSTIGTNIYLIVANVTKEYLTLCNEIGYWLSFICNHGKALDIQQKLKVIIVLSHSDHLSEKDVTKKFDSIKQYFHTHMNEVNEQIIDIIDIVSCNCRYPRSSRVVDLTLQPIAKNVAPYSLSFETTLLHGMLMKDFGNVVACKFQHLLGHIRDTGICLPTAANALYPIVKELHDIGFLTMIGRSKYQLEDYLLLLDLPLLTNKVHQTLDFISYVGPHCVNIGILPESYLTSILAQHMHIDITKECLIQLQYCQEFSHAEVGLDSSDSKLLYYFPTLCNQECDQSNWPSNPKLNFSIGWYTKCTAKFDYFPAQFLHVLLLRLAFSFALPTNFSTDSIEVSAHGRRCTMWKNGIRWLMEEGVECIFEMVDNSKGFVVITKSEEYSYEWADILGQIIANIMQAKRKFCNTASLQHFLLKSGSPCSFKDQNKLFAICDIERVVREQKKKVVSVSGQIFLDSAPVPMFDKLISIHQSINSGTETVQDGKVTGEQIEAKRTKLEEKDHPKLLKKLSIHSAKWREIGSCLCFLPSELDDIQARPLLLNTAPKSFLSAMLAEWLQWAPKDSRESTGFATLESLTEALNKAGLGETARSIMTKPWH